MAEPLSEAQQLLARLKVRNEQSKAAAAGLSIAPADTSSAPSAASAGGVIASNKPSFSGANSSWAADSATLPAEVLEEDEPDATTITSISKIVLRGAGGFCLSAVAIEAAAAGAVENAVPTPTRFRGSADGRGFGDPHECLTLHNRHAVRLAPPPLGHSSSKNSLDVAAQPMRYGDRVMLRSRFARERCLAPLPGAGGDLAFERNLGGKAEDWELLPAATGATDSAGFDNAATARRQLSSTGSAGGRTSSGYPASLGSSHNVEPGSLSGSAGAKPVRGACLRAGDRIALKSCLTGELLVLNTSGTSSGSSAASVGTAPAGHSSSDACTWTVLVAGAPYVPPWAQQRPYLTGQFLLQSQRSAPSARVVEQLFGAASARFVTSGKNNASSGGGALDSASNDGHDLLPPPGSTHRDPPPLSSLPASVQEQLVLDDLLSAFMGLEGTYVKAQVVAPSSTAAGENGAKGGRKGRSEGNDNHPDDDNALSRVEFVFNGLKLDKSLGALAERMLPCGSAYVGVKAFVHEAAQPARGLVAHALGAGLKVGGCWDASGRMLDKGVESTDQRICYHCLDEFLLDSF